MNARTDANRRNAKRSTGLRSAAGKQAYSKNSTRHGLNMSIPPHDPEVGALVEDLAAGFSGPAIEAAALMAVRAILAYHRVQKAYSVLYAQSAGPIVLTVAPGTPTNPASLPSSANLKEDPYGFNLIAQKIVELYNPPADAVRSLSVFEFSKELDRLALYARRANSHRTKALRLLNVALDRCRVGES